MSSLKFFSGIVFFRLRPGNEIQMRFDKVVSPNVDYAFFFLHKYKSRHFKSDFWSFLAILTYFTYQWFKIQGSKQVIWWIYFDNVIIKFFQRLFEELDLFLYVVWEYFTIFFKRVFTINSSWIIFLINLFKVYVKCWIPF